MGPDGAKEYRSDVGKKRRKGQSDGDETQPGLVFQRVLLSSFQQFTQNRQALRHRLETDLTEIEPNELTIFARW